MREELAMPNEPILLATDGMRDSDAAVRAAADLAAATRRPVTVIAVLEPPPIVAGEYGFVVPVESVWEDRRDALLARVRKQIQHVVGCHPEWLIEVRTGNPPRAIAKAAETLNAAVIVMGLGQHHLLDRALGTETALHTLRAARRPVFAVPQTYGALPSRAVVGIDFGDAGVAAAQRALALLPSLTRLALVHVAPHWDLEPTAHAEWRAEYECGMLPALERVIRELDAPSSVTVSIVIRDGKPIKELLKVAEEYEADVIMVGSKGLGFLDRMLVGSTASGIIRGAQAAVFAFPTVALATPAASRVPAEVAACAVGA